MSKIPPASKRHYHVIVKLEGGYLPSQSSYHNNRLSAEMEAQELARRWRFEGLRVDGTVRKGYVIDERRRFDEKYALHTLCYVEKCHDYLCEPDNE
jgi:hypothetical protein